MGEHLDWSTCIEDETGELLPGDTVIRDGTGERVARIGPADLAEMMKSAVMTIAPKAKGVGG